MTDDLFDPLLDVENQFSQQGRTEGRSDGQAQGYDEGFSFGHSKSIELGKELGFYLGCVEMWFMLYSKYPERFHIRTKKSLENLRKLIKEFSFDAKKDNVIYQIEEIRAKFKLIQTLVGAKQRIVETTAPSLSF
jgi:flagellar biosynthesis/type III secretory pathway protein FliH